MSGPDHRGCGSVTVTAVAIEELIVDAVLYRLDTPALRDALTGQKAADERLLKVRDQLEADRAKMDELATMWADGEITRESWKTARERLQPRIEKAEKELSRSQATPTLEGLIGRGQELREAWESMNLGRQAAIIGAVLDHAKVYKSKVRGHFRPDRVVPVWAL
jgi:chromosome segregation ATPase